METMTVRQGSSDDRIDGLERKVDEGFRHVDKRFEQVDKRFERLEDELKAQRRDFNMRFEAIDDRMHGFNRTLMTFCIAMLAAFIGLIGTMLTITLTQL
jgi:biopolymer transport protein ExbB/TolQ